MSKYVIGFYNPKIENEEMIKNYCINICNQNRLIYYKPFFNIEDMEKNLREGDIIIFNSILSMYDIKTSDLLTLQNNYNLKLFIKKKDNICFEYTSFDQREIEIAIGIVNFIKEEKDVIKKLL